MLGPGDFTAIVAFLCIGALVGVLLVGLAHRRQAATPPRDRARRDPIAKGTISPQDVTAMLAAENARLREQGRPEYTRGEFEGHIVGSPRFLHRVMRLRLRKRLKR